LPLDFSPCVTKETFTRKDPETTADLFSKRTIKRRTDRLSVVDFREMFLVQSLLL